eukprot:747637-Hanusia_phi.AAC.2
MTIHRGETRNLVPVSGRVWHSHREDVICDLSLQLQPCKCSNRSAHVQGVDQTFQESVGDQPEFPASSVRLLCIRINMSERTHDSFNMIRNMETICLWEKREERFLRAERLLRKQLQQGEMSMVSRTWLEMSLMSVTGQTLAFSFIPVLTRTTSCNLPLEDASQLCFSVFL